MSPYPLVGNDAEAADQQIAGSGLVQRPADADDVTQLRRSRVAIIILAIRASAGGR